MKKLLTLLIASCLMQIVFAQTPTRCWVSSDYDFNDTKGKGVVTVCNRGSYITVVIPESGIYTFYTESQNSFVDSATKLYYTECVGDLSDYDKAYVFNRLGDKRIYVANREWSLTVYNVTKKGMPAPAKKPQRYTGNVVEYIVRDSIWQARENERIKQEEYEQAMRDTVKPDFSEAQNFLLQNIKYPATAYSEGKEGKVLISLTVNNDGSLSKIKPLTSFGYGLEDEAVRVIKLMPAPKPGTIKGVPTPMHYVYPVTFKLN